MTEKILKSIGHFGPVTALKFNGDYLWVGEGPRLKKYDWKKGDLINEIRVFKRDKVHGIVINDNNEIVCWGGPSISFVSNNDTLTAQKKMNDWISSVAFAKNSDANVFVQTAHNAVYSIDRHYKIIEIVNCEEDSILYSGTILPLENGDALVAAGTVLNGVVIWRLNDNKILKRYTSHEGSIFGVVISPDGKQVISCSDDRSIRLWGMEGDDEDTIGWGHLGRIWQLDFLGNNHVISISEDCSANVWEKDGNKLNAIHKFEGHLGRNAWCGSINFESNIFATGGGDGRIRLWDLSRIGEVSRTVEPWEKNIPTFQKGEALKSYDIVKNGYVFASNKSRLFLRQRSGTWTPIDTVQVDTQSLVEGIYDESFVCVGCGSGVVTEVIVQENDIKVLKTRQFDFKGRLCYLLTFKTENDYYYYVVSTANPNDPLYLVKHGSDEIMELERPMTFHPTAITYANGMLYMGSRHGALVAYKFNGDEKITPIFNCWRRVVSEETISCICITDNGLYLTTRLGEYSYLRINGSTLEIFNNSRIPKGALVGCQVVNGSLMLYGFRNELFFVWDDTLQYELMNEKCGGMHRTWRFYMSPKTAEVHEFVYYKVNNLNIVQGIEQQKFNCSVIQSGTHGREIRTAEFSPNKLPNGSAIIATASEDTCIRFCSFKDRELKTHVIQRKHVSGMQSVHWTPNGRYLISSAANEELIVWKITLIDNNIHATFHAKLPTSTDIPDLRIMDFAVLELTSSQYILANVYSDSAIKLWLMDLETSTFQLLANTTYTTCCLLNCDFIVFDNQTYIIVSATDGHVIVYNVTSALQGDKFPDYKIKLQLHQSGVKGSSIQHDSCGKITHVSGGDDNALVKAELDLVLGSGTILAREEDAHIATITDISRINDNYITVSADQNVRLWDSELNLVETKFTTVADTGLVDVIDNMAVIGGSGLSFWEVDN